MPIFNLQATTAPTITDQYNFSIGALPPSAGLPRSITLFSRTAYALTMQKLDHIVDVGSLTFSLQVNGAVPQNFSNLNATTTDGSVSGVTTVAAGSSVALRISAYGTTVPNTLNVALTAART